MHKDKLEVQSKTENHFHEEWEQLFASLPGGSLVREGLSDLARKKHSVSALLVQIGSPRLRALGLEIAQPEENVEHQLYDLLAAEDSDSAHSRYNALLRTLISFERAAECAAK